MMWTYVNSEPGLWTVGYYNPSGDWNPDSDHDSQEKAGRRVHFLNGGREEKETPPDSDQNLFLEILRRILSLEIKVGELDSRLEPLEENARDAENAAIWGSRKPS